VDPARGRADPRRDRDADHRAHERRPQDRLDRAADPQGGGRRPDEGRIGHCGDTTDLDYLREIADAGSLLGMDRFGIDVFLPFEDHITTVAALAQAGYADWMVLAHDASCYSDFYSESYKAALLPRWNYTHITDDVLPALREHGVDEAQITAMLVHNPARYFTGGQK
jgi:phosphotriesterase-related protein